ncbi:MAG: adenylosuccinate synthase, partial [Sphingobacteriales bacterium]
MAVDVLIGLQWGDEGKGKVVDVLAPNYDIVARFQGGPNAGHTVIVGDTTHKFHLIPSGILTPRSLCLMADGMVIAPELLVREIATLREHGLTVENLRVSQNAQVILPYHRKLDTLE